MTPKRIISDCCSLRMICNTHVQHATYNTQHRTCNTQHEAAHERHGADKSSPCGARCAQRNATQRNDGPMASAPKGKAERSGAERRRDTMSSALGGSDRRASGGAKPNRWSWRRHAMHWCGTHYFSLSTAGYPPVLASGNRPVRCAHPGNAQHAQQLDHAHEPHGAHELRQPRQPVLRACGRTAAVSPSADGAAQRRRIQFR